MTSDEQRREVARKLRETKQDCDRRESPWMVEDLMQAIGFGGYEDGEEHIFDRLAELIDSPTCKDVGGSCVFVCSKCGCAVDLNGGDDEPTMWVGGRAAVPRYCPNCRAEVIDD